MNRLRYRPDPLYVSVICLLLPLVAINAVYLWSASAGHVPWCTTYFEGCTSISRAARPEPINLLFRWTMLPWALLVGWYWWLSARWLSQQFPQRRISRRAMGLFAVPGTVGAALYALYLGGDSALAQIMRSYGGVLVFSSLAFAQLMLAIAVRGHVSLPPWLYRAMLGLCLVLLSLAVVTAAGNAVLADGYALVSAMEWSFGLVMLLFFPLTGLAWRYTGFDGHAAAR